MSILLNYNEMWKADNLLDLTRIVEKHHRLNRQVSIPRKDAKMNIDLWPSSTWTQKELQRFVDTLEEFEPTSGQISSNIRGIEIQIIISFAAGAIAASFFGKLGSDLYDHLKNRIKKLLLKRTSEKDIHPLDVNGRLSFKYSEPAMNVSVRYTCIYSSELELDVFLSALSHLDIFIRRALHSRFTPFDKDQSYDIFTNLEFYPESYWNIRVNDFFRTQVRVKGLENLKWEQVEHIAFREEAIKILGENGNKKAVEPLIHALMDEDAGIRRTAAEALGKIKDPKAVEPLIHALKDEKPAIRKDAAIALGEIGDKKALEALKKLALNGEDNVREVANKVLYKKKNMRVTKTINV